MSNRPFLLELGGADLDEPVAFVVDDAELVDCLVVDIGRVMGE